MPIELTPPTRAAPPTPRNTRPAATLVAEFRGVGHAYGATVALDGFELEVVRGEVVAVLGPNGAGKTTALHMLMGLLAPQRGSVRLFGLDPRAGGARERLGAMLQLSGVPETLTVREHLRLFASYYPAPRPLDEVLALTALNEVVDRSYGTLSGGQKQRLHLAIALVGDPDLLVLDEPTTGLDAASRRALWTIFRALLGRGRAIVLTTHDLEEADLLADRIVLLHRGRILAEGPPEQIKARTASRRVRVVTHLAESWFRAQPGVHDVRRDGSAIEALCGAAEPLVRAVLIADPDAHGLAVGGATLEDAFLALTSGGAGTTPDGATLAAGVPA
ncbi:MAG: ABC transporter ATP-binding protein [Trueperaceae bacterium]|nr:ABC transporter ATP-binding protein [Trueperaceae bacterium]